MPDPWDKLKFFYDCMELFAMESNAFLVFRSSLGCWFDVVGEHHDRALTFLGFFVFRAAGGAAVASVLGSICRVTFLEGFGGVAEF